LQSKAQVNLQSLGEKEIGYRAENIISFHRWKLHEKFLFIYTDYPADNVLLCKAMLVRYQLFITFILCYYL